MPKKVSIPSGQRFGLLTVLKQAPTPSSDGQIRWLCCCDCGRRTIAVGSKLRSGHTRSCGCLKLAVLRKDTHRLTGTPEHIIWVGMRRRCLAPSHPAYSRYGGRGITICPEWGSFTRFLADMGARPTAQHSIDRVDNDGPYSPENCRWATPTEQSRNRRHVKRYEHDGLSITLAEWAEKVGMSLGTLKSRVERWGWMNGGALTRPLRRW